MSQKKPKILTLTHPAGDTITVNEGSEDMYLSQGWELASEAPAVKDA